jgi:hypothetical protein
MITNSVFSSEALLVATGTAPRIAASKNSLHLANSIRAINVFAICRVAPKEIRVTGVLVRRGQAAFGTIPLGFIKSSINGS